MARFNVVVNRFLVDELRRRGASVAMAVLREAGRVEAMDASEARLLSIIAAAMPTRQVLVTNYAARVARAVAIAKDLYYADVVRASIVLYLGGLDYVKRLYMERGARPPAAALRTRPEWPTALKIMGW